MSKKRPLPRDPVPTAPSHDDEFFLDASDDDDDEDEAVPYHSDSKQPSKHQRTLQHKSGPGTGKRDKHAPAEMSSKRRPPLLQTVVDVPKVVRRGECALSMELYLVIELSACWLPDPRFEETSGRLKEQSFRTAYNFLDDSRLKPSAGTTALTEWHRSERERREKVLPCTVSYIVSLLCM